VPKEGLQCLQENLKKGLAIVRRAIPKRCSLPQAECVLLESDGSRLKLTGTDLETAVSTWIGAQVDSDLAVMVKVRMLTNAINSLPNERISLKIVDKQLRLTCEGGVLNLLIKHAAEDYPPIPSVEGDPVTLDPESLRRAIRQTEIAVSGGKTRPVLQAINMRLDGRKLTLAAADDYRLAVHDMELDAEHEQCEINIPDRAVRILYALLAKEEEAIAMTLDASNVRFDLRNTVITMHLVDGTFPQYLQLIPKNWGTKVTVYRADLLRKIQSVGLVARYGEGIVRLEILAGSKVKLSAKSGEIGQYVVEIDAALEGQEGKVAFNYLYLTEALEVMDSEQVTLEITPPSSPVVLRPVGRDNYTYVFMPMFVQW